MPHIWKDKNAEIVFAKEEKSRRLYIIGAIILYFIGFSVVAFTDFLPFNPLPIAINIYVLSIFLFLTAIVSDTRTQTIMLYDKIRQGKDSD